MVEVTQADIEAVKWFYKHAVKWMLDAIIRDDPIGEDRDLNHPIYQAFARHRIAAEQRGMERERDRLRESPDDVVAAAKKASPTPLPASTIRAVAIAFADALESQP